MKASDHKKLQDAGFTIIRAESALPRRIKYKGKTSSEWRTLEKDFKSEYALKKRMLELLKDPMTVED